MIMGRTMHGRGAGATAEHANVAFIRQFRNKTWRKLCQRSGNGDVTLGVSRGWMKTSSGRGFRKF